MRRLLCAYALFMIIFFVFSILARVQVVSQNMYMTHFGLVWENLFFVCESLHLDESFEDGEFKVSFV